MRYKNWSRDELYGEVVRLKHRECNLICSNERANDAVDTVLGWCKANIDDKSQMTTFATQIRDCLENGVKKPYLYDFNSEMEKALMLAKEMIISNGLDIPKTMTVINKALNWRELR